MPGHCPNRCLFPGRRRSRTRRRLNRLSRPNRHHSFHYPLPGWPRRVHAEIGANAGRGTVRRGGRVRCVRYEKGEEWFRNLKAELSRFLDFTSWRIRHAGLRSRRYVRHRCGAPRYAVCRHRYGARGICRSRSYRYTHNRCHRRTQSLNLPRSARPRQLFKLT